MKHNMKTLLAAVLASSTALVVVPANGASASSSSSLKMQSSASQSTSIEAGQKVSLDQVPEAAKKTILQHSAGTNPKEVRMITQKGQRCYTAIFDKGREKSRVTVDRDGSVVALQQSAVFASDVDLPKLQKSQIGFNQLPQPVQRTIKEQAGSAQVGNLSKSQVNGKPIYRADFNRGGVRHELFITPQGQLAAQVREVTVASRWTFDENGNLVANPGRQINEAAGAQAPQSNQNKTQQK